MLPLHLHGWKRASSGVSSPRHIRQLGVSLSASLAPCLSISCDLVAGEAGAASEEFWKGAGACPTSKSGEASMLAMLRRFLEGRDGRVRMCRLCPQSLLRMQPCVDADRSGPHFSGRRFERCMRIYGGWWTKKVGSRSREGDCC